MLYTNQNLDLMKSIALVLIMTCSFAGFSQNEDAAILPAPEKGWKSPIHFGVSTFSHFNTDCWEPSITPAFEIYNEKFSIQVGPQIGLQRNGKLPLNGFSIFNKIYPNGKGKNFNFYVAQSFDLYTAKRQAWWWGPLESGDEVTILPADEYTQRFTAMSAFIGYGMEIKFLKHFYFDNNVGLGATMGRTKYLPSKQIYDMFMMNAQIRVGFGYRF